LLKHFKIIKFLLLSMINSLFLILYFKITKFAGKKTRRKRSTP
jgi:hypothetical protein